MNIPRTTSSPIRVVMLAVLALLLALRVGPRFTEQDSGGQTAAVMQAHSAGEEVPLPLRPPPPDPGRHEPAMFGRMLVSLVFHHGGWTVIPCPAGRILLPLCLVTSRQAATET